MGILDLGYRRTQSSQLCLRLRRLILAVVLVRVALSKHLLELLLLRVAQESFDLAVAILHDRLSLTVAILLAEQVVGAEGLHLLLAVSEDGLNLRYLIAGEAELLAQMRGLLAGVHGAVLFARLRIGSGLVGIRRLCKQCACKEQRAQDEGSFCHAIHLSISPIGRSCDDRPLRV